MIRESEYLQARSSVKRWCAAAEMAVAATSDDVKLAVLTGAAREVGLALAWRAADRGMKAASKQRAQAEGLSFMFQLALRIAKRSEIP